MSLMSEIQALRAQIDAHAHNIPATAADATSASEQPKSTLGGAHHQPDVEALLTMIYETLDEFANELDRFPRLTALAALSVGLAAGIVIGRQLR